jgi:hypothetical protein
MGMAEALVTLPLWQYDKMKDEIEKLKKESVKNYIRKDFTDFEANEYNRVLDVKAIRQDFKERPDDEEIVVDLGHDY